MPVFPAVLTNMFMSTSMPLAMRSIVSVFAMATMMAAQDAFQPTHKVLPFHRIPIVSSRLLFAQQP